MANRRVLKRKSAESGTFEVRAVFRVVLRSVRVAALAVGIAAALAGCETVVNSATSGLAQNLSTAILDQEDPELVREGVPTLLLLLDSMVVSSPDDSDLLGAAAELYAVYGVAFVSDRQRAKTLTARARELGERALCAEDRAACALDQRSFDEYERIILDLRPGAADALYSYSIASLAYIRTHGDDMIALADLPKVEAALKHLLELGVDDTAGQVNMYLGILNSLRPPALGGQPELGRRYFETAMGLTGGKDLSVKVEYARGYARLVYDRELHDRLLNDVLASEVQQPGLTLANSLARQQALELLASADDYF